MKLSVVFLCCALAAFQVASGAKIELPQEIVELLENLSKTCQEETGVDHALVAEIRKAKLSEDPKAKCYLKCIMRQLQAMTESGDLDTDLIEATLPDAVKEHGAVETLHKCKHIKEPDLCETAYKIMVCFQKENPTLTALFE